MLGVEKLTQGEKWWWVKHKTKKECKLFPLFVTSICQFPSGESTKFMHHPLDGITLGGLGSPWISQGIFLAPHSALWSQLLWPQLGLHFSSSHTHPLLLYPINQSQCCFMRVILLFFQAALCVKEPLSPTHSSQLVLGSFTPHSGHSLLKGPWPTSEGTGGISLVLPLDTLCTYFMNCEQETAD